ncbi:hypothetical protein J6590_084527, partial [Homalodisca vitripennis]
EDSVSLPSIQNAVTKSKGSPRGTADNAEGNKVYLCGNTTSLVYIRLFCRILKLTYETRPA